MKKYAFSARAVALIVAACAIISLFCLFAETVSAEAAPLPAANTAQRHKTCVALSDGAKNYYKGDFSYQKLIGLPGAKDCSDSGSAMRGNALFDALHDLMADTHVYYTSYSGSKPGSLAYYWKSTDAASGIGSFVLFYSDVPGDAEGAEFNREHVWAKSRASYSNMNGGADLHHLRPSLEKVNADKSDHAFGYIGGTYSDGYKVGVIDGTELYRVREKDGLFECKDDVKGDVARILLYVYCRWEQPNLYSDVAKDQLPDLDGDDKTDTGMRAIESLDTLLAWCEDDPVDEWEMRRNDLVEQVQGNRNVFIDYPELAWRIFGLEVPADLATPTRAGCVHERIETARTAPLCEKDGSFTETCVKCGNAHTRRIAAVGHSDSDGDGVCDRCGEELVIRAGLKPVTALNNGTHVLLYHPASQKTLSGRITSSRRAESVFVNERSGVIDPGHDCAVFTVKNAGNGSVYFIYGDRYLTTAKSGGNLFFTSEPDEYSRWLIENADGGTVYVVNENAQYDSKRQMLEYYNGSFTTYGGSGDDSYKFKLYARDEHLWDGQTGDDRVCLLCKKTKAEIDHPPYRRPVDIPETSWFTAAVEYCVTNGVMVGTSEMRFSPEGTVTRAQFVQILARIGGADLDDPALAGSSFVDVPDGRWYSRAVKWASGNGYAYGTGGGKFSPDAPVTRQQTATFLYTFSAKNGLDVSASASLDRYSDSGSVGMWAKDAVSWAVGVGLISGTSETTISPEAVSTRAQISLIAMNYIENYYKK